jgi:iron complex transport system permease protein
MLLSPVDIPVGVVTAVIGGPFFLWLLVTRG